MRSRSVLDRILAARIAGKLHVGMASAARLACGGGNSKAGRVRRDATPLARVVPALLHYPKFGHSALKPTAFLNDLRNPSRPERSVSERIVFFIRGPALPSAVSHLLTTDGNAGPRMKKDSCGF